MTSSRREFLKTTGMAFGAIAIPPWVLDEEAEAALLDKKSLADIALSSAKRLGTTYADIRINRYRFESISTRERQVQNVARNQNFGFGVRVLWKGAWGFAASRIVAPEEVRRVTARAVEIARANAVYQRKPVELLPVPAIVTSWKSAFEKDPFTIPMDDKIQFLLKLNETAMKTKGVGFVNSSLLFVNEQKFY